MPPVNKTWVLLAGLPCTGKSTLAAALARHLHPAVVLSKDDIRAALFPGNATDYTGAQNDICMEALLTAAAYLSTAAAGAGYILIDGRTFSRAEHIERVVQAAVASRAAWRILHLWCPDETAIARLSAHDPNHPAKDRNVSLYLSLKNNFEPILHQHLSVDTSRPLEQCLHECAAYLVD